MASAPSRCLKTTCWIVSVSLLVMALGYSTLGIIFSTHLKRLNNFREFDFDSMVFGLDEIPFLFLSLNALISIISYGGLFLNPLSKKWRISYIISSALLIVFLIVSGITSVILGTTYHEQKDLKDYFSVGFDQIGQNGTVFSVLESKLHCCGMEGPQDYNDRLWGPSKSCCVTPDCFKLYSGCLEKYMNAIAASSNENFLLGTIGCPVVGVLAFCSIFLTSYIRTRLEPKEYGGVH